VGHPLEDVSVCGVLRCVWGVCERHGYVVCCLVVLGLPFWPFSGSELMWYTLPTHPLTHPYMSIHISNLVEKRSE
jgi:hypothetical protein